MKANMMFILLLFLATTATAIANPIANPLPLAGYWQNFNNPADTPVRLTDIPKGYKVINIAFADMNTDGSVGFLLQGPPYLSMPNGDTVFKNDIKEIQARGVKVLLSLGGQNGFYQIDNQTKENNFVASLKQLITTYGFDGLDYDIENGLTTVNAAYLVDATRQLRDFFKGQAKPLTFTLAPETIDVYWQTYPNGKYDSLIQSDLIDSVQVQLYNSGCMPGSKPGSACYSQGTEDFIVSQADSTIQIWMKNGIANAAQKYMIGLPASIGAAGGGYVDPAVIKKALSCLQTQTNCATYVPTQMYPQLGGFMTWSINWDAKNGYAFEKAVT